MKKSKSKLELKTSTVRVLQPGELAEVHGGTDVYRRPSNNPTQCSASLHCEVVEDQP